MNLGHSVGPPCTSSLHAKTRWWPAAALTTVSYMQVRGKDFRHEKTKKKRGGYRGGSLDSAVRSQKFVYDDDE